MLFQGCWDTFNRKLKPFGAVHQSVTWLIPHLKPQMNTVEVNLYTQSESAVLARLTPLFVGSKCSHKQYLEQMYGKSHVATQLSKDNKVNASD